MSNNKFDAMIAIASMRSCMTKAQRICAHPILSYLPYANSEIVRTMIQNRITKFKLDYLQNPNSRYVRTMIQFVKKHRQDNEKSPQS